MLLARPVLTVAAASVAATNFGSGWQNGICGTTTQFEGRRCRVSEKQGSWVAASRKYCAALCVACPRCHYVSYSKADNDCSWFRTCDFHKSPRGLMAVSLQVRLDHGLVAAGTLATSQRNHTRSSVTRPHSRNAVHWTDSPTGAYARALVQPYGEVLLPTDPPVHVREDGERLLMHAEVEGCKWIPMLINMLLGLRRVGVRNMTIVNRKARGRCVGDWVQMLGYNLWRPFALNYWARVALAAEALRRGIGVCTFDADAYLGDDAFFEGSWDVAVQGKEQKYPDTSPLCTEPTHQHQGCGLCWRFPYASAADDHHVVYINQGIQCMVANGATVRFMRSWLDNNARHLALKQNPPRPITTAQLAGDPQLAHVQAVCQGGFRWTSNHTSRAHELQSSAELQKLGLKLRIVKSSPTFVHVKGISCKGLIDAATCKVNALKKYGGWLLPADLELRFPEPQASDNEWVALLHDNAFTTRIRSLFAEADDAR